MSVELAVEGAVKRAVIYRYDSSWNLEPRELQEKGGKLLISVPDSVAVLGLSLEN